MEVYARELIPRLAAIDGVEPIAFVNREAAGEPGPWHDIANETCRSRRATASSGCAASSSSCRGWRRARVATSSTASPRRRRCAGRFVRVTTIHDLNYKLVPDAHFGLLRLGMGVLVPAAARRSHADHRRRRVDGATSSASRCRSREGRRGAARRQPGVDGRADAGAGAARPARSRRPADPAQRVGEATAQEPVAAARRPRAHRRSRPPAAGPARLPHPARAGAGRARRGAGRSEHVGFPPGSTSRDLEGLYAAATAFVFPSLYEGFGLPVLEAMARGVPSPARTARRCPRSPATRRCCSTPRTDAAIRSALVRLLGDASCASGCVPPVRARAALFTWDATAAATAAAYERALRVAG